MKSKTLVAFLLCAVMLIGMLPTPAVAYYEDPIPEEPSSIDVHAEGKTYSLYTEDNLENTKKCKEKN